MITGPATIRTALPAMLLACTTVSALGQSSETGPQPADSWSGPWQSEVEVLPRVEETWPATSAATYGTGRCEAKPVPTGQWAGLDHRGQVTQQAPPWSWAHWWCSRPDMLQRHAYYPESHGYYYFRPYTVAHVRMHQEFVRSWGGDPRTPYSNEIFERLQPQSAAPRQPSEGPLSLGPASDPGATPRRR